MSFFGLQVADGAGPREPTGSLGEEHYPAAFRGKDGAVIKRWMRWPGVLHAAPVPEEMGLPWSGVRPH